MKTKFKTQPGSTGMNVVDSDGESFDSDITMSNTTFLHNFEGKMHQLLQSYIKSYIKERLLLHLYLVETHILTLCWYKVVYPKNKQKKISKLELASRQ